MFTSASWLINLLKKNMHHSQQYHFISNQMKLSSDVRLSIVSRIPLSLLTEENRQWTIVTVTVVKVTRTHCNSVLSSLIVACYSSHIRVMLVTETITETKSRWHISNSALYIYTFQQYLFTCTNNQTQQTLSSVSNHPSSKQQSLSNTCINHNCYYY